MSENNKKMVLSSQEKPSVKISTHKLFRDNIKKLLFKISWKKSMRWGEHNLYWGRPLKSILAVFDKTILDFNLNHLQSSNKTFVDKNLEENLKKFTDFKNYEKFFKLKNIIIDQELRKGLNQNPNHYQLHWRSQLPKGIRNFIK